jgi:hypothetical protein
MTTIDHAGALAVSRPDTLSDDHVAARALQVARRTALGILGDAEAAADIAQDVAITAVPRARSLRDPAALDAWLHRIAVRAALREPGARVAAARPSAPVTIRHRRPTRTSRGASRSSTDCPRGSAPP